MEISFCILRLRPRIAPAMLCGLAAMALTACGPARPDATSQNAGDVRGEPITTNAAPAARVATAAPPAVSPAATPVEPEYVTVGFDRLAAYSFVTDDTPFTNQDAAADKASQQIPGAIKALEGKKISLRGFMLPLKVENGAVTEFLILKDQTMCCYGNTPRMNEWVTVKTTGAGVPSIMDQPVSIMGTLHVGARRDNGYLTGIYQMDGDKLDATAH